MEEIEVGGDRATPKFFSDCCDVPSAGAETVDAMKYKQAMNFVPPPSVVEDIMSGKKVDQVAEVGDRKRRRGVSRLFKKSSSIVRMVKSRGHKEKFVNVKNSYVILPIRRSMKNKIVEELHIEDTYMISRYTSALHCFDIS